MNERTIGKSSETDGAGKIGAIKETVFEVKDKIVDMTSSAVKTGNATLEKTRQFVAARPLTALAIAFGVGYVAMRVTRMFR